MNPVTGKKEFSLMSHQQELALGKQSDPSIVAQFGLYQDEKLQAFINQKGKEMGSISHRPDLEYSFKILDSPVVNAFAVPGGYVYFTRGILAHFNNEAEFAGVLGHEIGHVTARHSAKQYTKATLAQVGLVAGVVLSKDFRQYANQANQGLQLLFLKFGRDNESQSDRLGVEYSTKIGYDAHHMANFFNTLHNMRGDDSGGIPTFMSTHPDPLDRYENVNKLAGEWQAKDPKSSYKENRDSYLRMIDGLIYGEDPRQGYVEGGIFYHPEMKFQFPVPSGWKTQNSPSQFQMAPESGDAMVMLTLAAEKNLDSAMNSFITNNKLTLVNSQKTRINSFSAIAVTSDQMPEADPTAAQGEQNPKSGGTTVQPELRIRSHFIFYNGNVYAFHGLSKFEQYNSYLPKLEESAKNFKKLIRMDKINVKPTRIQIKTVNRAGTLSSALQSFGAKSDQMETLALLNGMDLNDPVKQGMLIKVLGE